MSFYSQNAEPAEPSNLFNNLRRNRPRNQHGTCRNLNRGWFRSVPVKFRRVVPLYVIKKKEWFRRFRYFALAAIAGGSSAAFPALPPGGTR